jgi:hypothetical protein
MAFGSLVGAIPRTTAVFSSAVAVALDRFVHLERATFQIVTVKLLDCLLGLGTRAHLHESEPSGLARGSIRDDRDGLTCSRLSEQSFQVLLRDVVTKIADVELLSQSIPSRSHRWRGEPLRLVPSGNDTCYRRRELPESEVREIAGSWRLVFTPQTIRTS